MTPKQQKLLEAKVEILSRRLYSLALLAKVGRRTVDDQLDPDTLEKEAKRLVKERG
ncbi:unnamed protein product [marine sediment metagenome]|uniref:Uncharacterized protein n=1 Tax=marine sediment metagenome TaxID=412755 RepID=X0TR94_9ZZZZ